MSIASLKMNMGGSNPYTERPVEIALTTADFRTAYHSHPERFLKGGNRPLRMVYSKPPVASYENVYYTPCVTPSVESPGQKFGSLYDETLQRIELAVTRRGRNDKMRNADPERLSLSTREAMPQFDRPVLYLGEIRPHFGHFMHETLSRWWVLTETYSDIEHYLFHISNPRVFQLPYVKAALEALQIKEEQIVYYDRPARLRQVVVPASSFQLKSHIHSKYKDILHKLSRALGAGDVEQTEQPLYLSRTCDTRGVRRYVGEEKVEAYLAGRGVRIAHPGKLPFAEQAKMVNRHRTIIGFQGSQLANVMFALQPRTLVQFTDNEIWANHILIDKCYGHESTYVRVCKTDNVVRELYRYSMLRLKSQKVRFAGFSRAHRVDEARAIAWLEASGSLD